MYTFTDRASRIVSTGVNVFTDQEFTMKVIGEIDIGIAFSTPPVIGTASAGVLSPLSVVAVAQDRNKRIIMDTQ